MNARRAPRPAHRRAMVLRVWGNPLARGSDRAEAVLTVGLVIMWLLISPLVATIASAEWPSVETRVVAVQHSVTATDAVLLSDADVGSDSYSTQALQPMANASWLGRDGRPVDGRIVVRAGARAGEHQTIWLDGQGAIADPPMTTTTAAGLLVMVAVAGWLVLGALFWALRRGFRWELDRRRGRLWADDWASFDAGSRSG